MMARVARDLAAAVALVEAMMAERRMNTTDLARAARIDPATVADFLSGTRWPQRASRGKIEGALGLNPGAITRAAGGRPADPPQPPQPPQGPISVEAAIEADPQLPTRQQKDAALAVVRAMRGVGGGGGSSHNEDDRRANGL